MSKREHFYAEVERMKEWYRRCSTEHLHTLVATGSIKEYKAAAKAVLAERESGEPEPAGHPDMC